MVALLVKQFAQIVQAAGDRALVGVRVLQVLIWDVCARKKGAFGFFNVPLGHLDDSYVQVSSCKKGRWNQAKSNRE